MKKLFILAGVVLLGFTSISATNRAVPENCQQTYYYINRYVCGDVLIAMSEVTQGRGCTEAPVIVVMQENTMPVPCTHLHPPGGQY